MIRRYPPGWTFAPCRAPSNRYHFDNNFIAQSPRDSSHSSSDYSPMSDCTTRWRGVDLDQLLITSIYAPNLKHTRVLSSFVDWSVSSGCGSVTLQGHSPSHSCPRMGGGFAPPTFLEAPPHEKRQLSEQSSKKVAALHWQHNI
jgi:hypothetical protein